MAEKADMEATMEATMNAVMHAYNIVGRFHRNVADLFRTVIVDMEGRDLAYGALGDEDEVLLSPTEPLLRTAKRWLSKHVALPLQPLEDEFAPILLVHISVDKQFSAAPEVWLGTLSRLRSFEGEPFPHEDAVAYIFEDYFGPEDDWTEIEKWYEVTFEDEVVGATLGFCRLPLASLGDRDAVVREVCDRLYKRAEALAEDAEDDEE